jgi:hypothetical protein
MNCKVSQELVIFQRSDPGNRFIFQANDYKQNSTQNKQDKGNHLNSTLIPSEPTLPQLIYSQHLSTTRAALDADNVEKNQCLRSDGSQGTHKIIVLLVRESIVNKASRATGSRVRSIDRVSNKHSSEVHASRRHVVELNNFKKISIKSP